MGFRGRERDETRRHCHSFFQKNGSHLDTGSENGANSETTQPAKRAAAAGKDGLTPKCAVILSRQLLCRSAAVWDKLAWRSVCEAFPSTLSLLQKHVLTGRLEPGNLVRSRVPCRIVETVWGQCFNRPHSPQFPPPLPQPESTTTWTRRRRQPMRSRALTIADHTELNRKPPRESNRARIPLAQPHHRDPRVAGLRAPSPEHRAPRGQVLVRSTTDKPTRAWIPAMIRIFLFVSSKASPI
jgi:hypothetical protein